MSVNTQAMNVESSGKHLAAIGCAAVQMYISRKVLAIRYRLSYIGSKVTIASKYQNFATFSSGLLVALILRCSAF
jgi:hypothetical protein